MNSHTVFRLPLRTAEQAESSWTIRAIPISLDSIRDIFRTCSGFWSTMLLFLRNVTKISAIEITEQSTEIQYVCVSLSDQSDRIGATLLRDLLRGNDARNL